MSEKRSESRNYYATLREVLRCSEEGLLIDENLHNRLEALLAEPAQRIEGCAHPISRMIEWIDSGACPICAVATAGMLRDQLNAPRSESGDRIAVRSTESSASPEGWISVNDRVPPPNVSVLVYNPTFKRVGVGEVMPRDDGMMWTFERHTGHESKWPSLKWSHWMPLPASPTCEGERKEFTAPSAEVDAAMNELFGKDADTLKRLLELAEEAYSDKYCGITSEAIGIMRAYCEPWMVMRLVECVRIGMIRSIDLLPPAEHVQALEAVAEALEWDEKSTLPLRHMSVGWIAYNKVSGQMLELSYLKGWTVDVVMSWEDDLVGFLGPNKLEPIEDEI